MKIKSLLLTLPLLLPVSAPAQGTSFTWQGRLFDGPTAAAGFYDLQVKLYDGPAVGLQVPGTPVMTLDDVPVTDGLFTATLDFGASAFSGAGRWLEMGVRPGNSTGAFTTLSGRQALMATPYAIHSGTTSLALAVAQNSITGSAIQDNSLRVQDLLITGTPGAGKILGWDPVNGGTGFTWQDPPAGGGGGGSGWLLGGNSGINPATQFLGTTGPEDVVFRVNNQELARLTASRDLILQRQSDFGSSYSARNGLGIYGSPPGVDDGRPFAGRNLIAGPVLFGQSGGALGVRGSSSETVSLEWNTSGVAVNGTLAASGLFTANAAVLTGNISVSSCTIRGGADLAEPFAMSHSGVEPGCVVIIDEANPGKLKASTCAYDRKVAGIVSGANGIRPGISMIQEDKLEAGENVALSGRVYVKADTSAGAIQPGDLMTTSGNPGHAMKAADNDKAQGAILGKAMTGLANGSGLVLVLVTLQ